jgi:hypothetical protein
MKAKASDEQATNRPDTLPTFPVTLPQCCTPTEQEACCSADAKEECCGTATTEACGCR